jgi:CheY-like chemotaxis protein
VQLHGGNVTAMSDGPGRGSVFVVRLPLVESTAAVQAAPQDALAAPAFGGLRILVADDNQDAAETMSVLLEVLGHEVRRVHDGEAAVDMTAAFDPHLVLLDIGMPKLNGYESCERIRACEGGAARTLVAVTGWGQPQDLKSSSDAGFDHHLVKPVDIDTLVRLITERATAQRG